MFYELRVIIGTKVIEKKIKKSKTMSHKLTEGALKTIMQGGTVDEPIMQVLGSKRIASNNSDKERFRILVSDGKYLFSFAMLTTQDTIEDMASGDIAKNTIIKVKRYITSVINNTGKGNSEKRILVILDMKILEQGDEVGEKIGNPIQLSESDMAPVKQENGDDSSSLNPPAPKKPMLSNTSSMNTTLNEQITFPIASLSPYQNKWVIKARVTNKSAIRSWSNSRGEGKLFSLDLMDESGEIRLTGFKDAVDKYYDFIQIDKVYYISKCQIKMANKQFSTLKNDYEMTINNDSVIQECMDDTNDIPTTQYSFVQIDKIAQMELNAVIDVIGIVKHASDIQTFTAKVSKRELKKRELTLVDSSKCSIALTLWGTDAENYNHETPVVVVKNARVGEFGGGKNITVSSGSIAKFNPDIPEAFAIRGWYDNGGDKEEASNISARSGGGSFQANWMSFKETKDQGLGNSDKGDYYQTKGTVLLFRSENSIYKACPTESCNKKVIDLENGQYRCEKCNAEFPEFKFRILGNVNIGDWSGNQWASMFTPEAEKVLGRTAQEYGESGTENPENFTSMANEAHFKQFIFKCRAKMETYNDEARLKTVAVRVEPINYKEYNSHLISQIQQLTG